MGRARRPHPQYLPVKLREIRLRLGLTQQEMLKRLAGEQSSLRVGHVSEFESGKREPSLGVLLAYSRLANLPLELLADDQLELPERPPRHLGPVDYRRGAVATPAGAS